MIISRTKPISLLHIAPIDINRLADAVDSGEEKKSEILLERREVFLMSEVKC